MELVLTLISVGIKFRKVNKVTRIEAIGTIVLCGDDQRSYKSDDGCCSQAKGLSPDHATSRDELRDDNDETTMLLATG